MAAYRAKREGRAESNLRVRATPLDVTDDDDMDVDITQKATEATMKTRSHKMTADENKRMTPARREPRNMQGTKVKPRAT